MLSVCGVECGGTGWSQNRRVSNVKQCMHAHATRLSLLLSKAETFQTLFTLIAWSGFAVPRASPEAQPSELQRSESARVEREASHVKGLLA